MPDYPQPIQTAEPERDPQLPGASIARARHRSCLDAIRDQPAPFVAGSPGSSSWVTAGLLVPETATHRGCLREVTDRDPILRGRPTAIGEREEVSWIWAPPWAWGEGGDGAGMYNSGYMSYNNPYRRQVGGYSDPSDRLCAARSFTRVNAPSGACRPGRGGQATARDAADHRDIAAGHSARFKDGIRDGTVRGEQGDQEPLDAVMSPVQIAGSVRLSLQTCSRDDSLGAGGRPAQNGPPLSQCTPTSTFSEQQQFQVDKTRERLIHDGAARFLLAYHYLTCGHPTSAAGELRQVVNWFRPTTHAELLKITSPPKEVKNNPRRRKNTNRRRNRSLTT